MINVPEEIKDLLHLDSWKKNIRIHFPNGERADICNNQIVMDSVQFTESLCSQNSIKFGLCESPIFQCEVVGVSNITKAVIDVCCEVYCDSTVEGAIWQNDLEHYVYQIPYGTFVVQTAKRQADMIHRKIVAYNNLSIRDMNKSDVIEVPPDVRIYMNLIADNQEVVKDYIIKTYNNSLTYDPFRRFYARLGYLEDELLEFTQLSVPGSAGGHTDYFVCEGVCFGAYYIRPDFGVTQASNNLYLYHMNELTKTMDEIYDWACTKLRGYASGSAYERIKEYIYKYLFDGYQFYKENDLMFNPDRVFSPYGLSNWYGRGKRSSEWVQFSCPFYQDKIFIYPYNHTKSGEDTTFGVYTPIQIVIGNRGTDPQTGVPIIVNDQRLTIRSDTNMGMKAYSVSCNYFGIKSATQKRVLYETAGGDKGYVLDRSVDDEYYQKFFEAYYALRGIYVKKNRDNVIEMTDIKQMFNLTPSDSLYPSESLHPGGVTGGKLLPQDYQSCWYDDYYSKPYGAIRCEYKNTSNNECVFTLYLPGFDDDTASDEYQIYDISSNYLIQEFTWTKAQVQLFCETIAANLSGVTYMPVEFVGRGLPYVEAGDTFEILTKSNDSITTIVLNRTIKGEQHLVDSYKSV